MKSKMSVVIFFLIIVSFAFMATNAIMRSINTPAWNSVVYIYLWKKVNNGDDTQNGAYSDPEYEVVWSTAKGGWRRKFLVHEVALNRVQAPPGWFFVTDSGGTYEEPVLEAMTPSSAK